MPKLKIDGRDIEAPKGTTILQAARQLGIHIPALCYKDGLEPAASCMLCVVKLKDPERFVPSCAMEVSDGMVVETDSDELRAMRRSALELLLSDHRGDCLAPCVLACPAHMDIPRMIRQIASGSILEAADTVRERIALGAVLGRICPAPCEKACRRRELDEPVAICLLKRFAADVALSSASLPGRARSSGRRVAVVGAGPAGLAAAYYLLREGVGCVVFDDRELPGGSLRLIGSEKLPLDVLGAECSLIERMGAQFVLKTKIERAEDLLREFAAVIVASGHVEGRPEAALGLPTGPQGIVVEKGGCRTPVSGVFAAGGAVRPTKMAVRSVADGRKAALEVVRMLSGGLTPAEDDLFTTRLGKLTDEEMAVFASGADHGARSVPSKGIESGFSEEEAKREAGRCLGCDCSKSSSCLLREYASKLGADPKRYEPGPSAEEAERRRFERVCDHPFVVYEKCKCVKCGICVRLTAAAAERMGLAFVGRGFGMKVAVPFGRPLRDGLEKVAEDCVKACPTGALSFKRKR